MARQRYAALARGTHGWEPMQEQSLGEYAGPPPPDEIEEDFQARAEAFLREQGLL